MKFYFWKLFYSKKLEKITPKNIFTIITSLERSRFLCVSQTYKGNGVAGINSRDVILVIGDIFYILSAPYFKGAFTDTAVKN